MITRTKTLIAAAAFAAIATSAFAQSNPEDLAYFYAGPGKLITMPMAKMQKHMDSMMKNASKVPANTVFFMNNGQLHSASGMLDPSGNFYIP